MAAKILTNLITGAANLTALEILIDAFLNIGTGAVVVDVHIKDDGTECLIFYYA